MKYRELASTISSHYLNRPPSSSPLLCVGLLTGAFIFVADLLRKLSVPYEIDFMVVSSYGKGTVSSGSGNLKLKKDMSIDPYNRDILIVEDLIDTGHTLKWIVEHLKNKKCKSLKVCCLLDKASRREVDLPVDYVGFEIPDEFVVGYGMDFAEQYRCMPLIGVLKPEAYAPPKAEDGKK
jgi:hypoxanthine phosphoribosyltransferase